MLFVLASCASLRKVEVVESETGERTVRVRATQSFDQLAREIWGDETRGRELADLAQLPYDRPVPAGTVLVVPGAGSVSKREADRLYDEAVVAATAKDYGEAVRKFRACLARDPGRVDARIRLGLVMADAGDPEAATTLLADVAEEHPRSAEAHYALGSVFRRRKSFGRALSEFETALDADPLHAKAAYAAARTLEDMKDVPGARALWERFLDRFPKDPLAADAQRRLSALERGRGGSETR
jgi:tetratricopeptide (TPR) repeat protein